MQELYLQVRNLKRNDKYSLLLIAAVLIAAFVKFMLLDDLQNNIELNKAVLSDREAAFNNYLAFAEKHNDFAAFAKEQQAAERAAYQLLPQSVSASGLIKEYTGLAAKYNLHVQSIKPVIKEERDKQAYQSFTFNLVLQGSFYKAAAFLDAVQNGRRLITAENVVLERNCENEAGGVILKIDLTAYALK